MPAPRSLLPFLFLAFSLPALAQNLTLQISNPQPRVGESFTVSFSMDFFNEQMSQQLQQQASLEVSQPPFTHKHYSRTFTATRAGQYTLGPYSFTFNGVTHTSNQLTIEVIEPLAKEEGIWLRQVQFGGEDFLILEQMIPNLQTTPMTPSEFEQGMHHDFEKAFASLRQQPAAGINLNRRHSTTAAESTDKTGKASIGYSLQIYRIEKEEAFAGSLQLQPEHFQNLPANIELPMLVLR
ncbi:BatD family protein [Cesiribacter andamanensis]|uniref:Uncharacterized protein n=1 Tax=Cesiribacter andamanensis AMV16 TaxID=1279009 RepID=M7NAN0_9BACT|nr:BatD family protein [Cesiribacter andamanensis]EMR04246.1 hypothetical protein ADICEAN_00654 [Cesiribacter andamanensis AMV16]